jgi:crossover junction endodeoxyribonuclease RusA
MRLTLPFPPTGNLYWRHARGRTYVSDEARRYRTGVKLRALTAGLRNPLEGPVCVSVAIYRPAKRGDLDNSLKVLLDSLRGVAFVDDSQVEELHAMRFEDKANPRAVVTVEAMT